MADNFSPTTTVSAAVPILGWDVGGANIKAVRIEQEDGTADPLVAERAFPLWREPENLSGELKRIGDSLGAGTSRMAITMTAELADCFATKSEGVLFVLEAFDRAFPGNDLWIYGVDARFRSPLEAKEEPLQVAASNWMASATLVARSFSDALFLDTGSTTTDIVPIIDGRVAALGRTDTERLTAGELVYTGALRTPVCAIVGSVPLVRDTCRIAAEHFAIAADAHLWLGRIEEKDYTCETPDGKGCGRTEAGARLSRMVCADMETLEEGDITAIAQHVAQAQISQIGEGIRQILRRLDRKPLRIALVAGAGVFLARAAAEVAGLRIYDLAHHLGTGLAQVAPAAAVAYLLASSQVHGRASKAGSH